MPELPDITVYIEALQRRVSRQALLRTDIVSPFLLRTFDPPLEWLDGLKVNDILRVGKRIVFAFEDDLYLVIHLMIAGRLHWKQPDAKLPARVGLAAFRFNTGALTLTEAGSKRRASLHLVAGRTALGEHDPGGIEVFACDLDGFAAALTRENHTLKRALTDPHLFSGIGNAYSDEILHAAGLSQIALTQRLSEEEIARLFDATRTTLEAWTNRVRKEAGGGFPEKITAFRDGMAVHGRFRQPCPVCGVAVQRIVYADNETNYCPRCQTGGKILKDRSLSRLLKDDWPGMIDDQTP